jgi:hypothetical protein
MIMAESINLNIIESDRKYSQGQLNLRLALSTHTAFLQSALDTVWLDFRYSFSSIISRIGG